jgi:DNA-binding CsgD family transcriptional regulator
MGGPSSHSRLAEWGVTRREAEVLGAVAERLSNAEIAARLYLSERTVESHVSALLRKLAIPNRVALGDFAHSLTGAEPPAAVALPAALLLGAESGALIGRERELDELRRRQARAFGGTGNVLVTAVTGEPGMGKSRLVAELAAETYAAGGQVLHGACFEDYRPPYDPFIQALGANAASLPKAELVRRVGPDVAALGTLVPELAVRLALATRGSSEPAVRQGATLGGILGYLTRAAARGRVLLVIEDLQWAAASTITALAGIARRTGTAPLHIVATCRAAVSDDHAPLELLDALHHLPAGQVLALHGLDEQGVAALVADLGGTQDPAVVHAAAGGNPLFVREFVRTGGVRSALRGLLSGRYALLLPRDLGVLEVAAVVGSEFDADLVARAHGQPLADVVESLERAEAVGLIARKGAGRFSFSHALYRDARYDVIPDALRRQLHGRIAEALDALARDDRLADLARHAAAAASSTGADVPAGLLTTSKLAARARRAARAAADEALEFNDLPAAVAGYRNALALTPEDDPERSELLLGLGRARFLSDRGGAEELAGALTGLRAAGDDEGAAEAEVMLGELAWIGSRWSDAQDHLGAAAALVEAQPSTVRSARVAADLARIQMISGDNAAARQSAARALDEAERFELPDLAANVLITRGPARVADGDLGGVEDLEAGVAIAARIGTPALARGYANLSYVNGLRGDRIASIAWRARARSAAETHGLGDLMRWADAHDADAALALGRWDDALRRAEAFIAAVETAAHYLVTVALRVRATVRLGRGNRIGALADAAAAVQFARGAGHPSNLLVALPFYARCLVDDDRHELAADVIAETLTAAAGNAVNVDLLSVALVLERLGRPEELRDLVSGIRLATPRVDAALAVASGDLAGAADVVEDLLSDRTAAAYLRLLAAERSGDPRSTELACGFYRNVGATAYVRRCEEALRRLRPPR